MRPPEYSVAPRHTGLGVMGFFGQEIPNATESATGVILAFYPLDGDFSDEHPLYDSAP